MDTMKKWLGCLLLLLALPSYAYIAQQEFPEQIARFISDIIVNQDGSLDITETITVHANQTQIKNGLVRWIPTQDNQNNYFSVLRYKLYDVLMDNKQLPYKMQRENKRFIIYIGDPKKLLAPGDYTYTIKYHVTNAVTFLSQQDQLTWNVTGNDWSFPIQSAEANIALPDGAAITHYLAYTGTQRDKRPFLKVLWSQKNKISFITTQPLIIHSGLTVAIAWPKGFITPPTWQEQVKAFVTNNPFLLLTLGLFVIIFWAGARFLRPNHKTRTRKR
jgi:fumarate reductase subunit D